MEFEWAEAKRIAVLRERGINFIDGQQLFDGRPLMTTASPRGGEERWVSVGELDGLLLAVVWTRRGDAVRIITMRRARDGERSRYQALFG
jgi:uncharacterized protein